MAQYPIPQFIEKEGKIIFFLTFRQFFLLVGGGAASFLIYFTAPFLVFVISAVLIMGTVSAIAFLKINNESIVTVLLHFIGFSMGVKNYIWKKKESPYPFKVRQIEQPQTQEIQTTPQKPIPKSHSSKLKEIKKMIETKKAST